MTNETRNKILTRIEQALENGFYLRQMIEAKLGRSFTTDFYGGCCVVGGLAHDFDDKGPEGNYIERDEVCDLLGIDEDELQSLEAGFEGWEQAAYWEAYDPEFYALGKFIADTYR